MKILSYFFNNNKRIFARNTSTATCLWLLSLSSTSTSAFTRSFGSSSMPSILTTVTATAAMSTTTRLTATATSVESESVDEPRFRTWPITSTKSLEKKLHSMGLILDAEQIDGTSTSSSSSSSSSGTTNAGALSDALVSVGTAGRGGTGSFISPQGLIITNWHVAYDAVRRASLDYSSSTAATAAAAEDNNIDTDVDYVRDGFVARSLQDEIEGPNYECWITERCIDVSSQVLEAASASSTATATATCDADNEIIKTKSSDRFADEFTDDDDDSDDDNDLLKAREEKFDDEFPDDKEEKEDDDDDDDNDDDDDDPLVRANKIRNIRQEIAQNAQKKYNTDDNDDNSIRCDVVEMIPNKSYVLFTYRRLRDVRIVYVPPKSLGGFGGGTDNFEWPRHTADFTLLRAYVPPPSDDNGDGSESKGSYDGYHPDNIPYDSSKSFIKIRKPSPETNIKENDFVFLLGFPGSTMRYAPSSRLRYANEIAVPHNINDYSKKLSFIARYEKDSNEAALKLGSTKKSLANQLKNNKGKLIMMNKLKLINERQKEEESQIMIEHGNGGNEIKTILNRLEEIYNEFRKDHKLSSTLDSLRGIYGGSILLAVGHHINEYLSVEKEKSDNDRETTYRKRNLPFLIKRLTKRLKDIYVPHEATLVEDSGVLFHQLAKEHIADDILLMKCFNSIMMDTVLTNREESRNSVLNDSHSSKLLSIITKSNDDNSDDEDHIEKLLSSVFDDEGVDDDSELWLDDPFVKVANSVFDIYKRDRDASKALFSERDGLFAKLLEFQKKHNNNDEDYYPDCNSSLRISAGYVEGYNAGDAIIHTPQTTLSGLYDKVTETKLLLQAEGGDDANNASSSEFECPDRLYKMLENDMATSTASGSNKDNDNIHNVPVCLLYSTDTIGGNSGSPVMNKYGELIGINFDRQRLGLMNEYKWSQKYSRSIGVDIRYILWLIGQYDQVSHLIDEMICVD